MKVYRILKNTFFNIVYRNKTSWSVVFTCLEQALKRLRFNALYQQNRLRALASQSSQPVLPFPLTAVND
jgi:hypothetical protein